MPLASGGKKECLRCGETKPVSDFHRNKKAKDGLYGYCKPCTKAKAYEWRAANPERWRENVREWQHANADKKREYDKAYYAANPEKYREYTRRHREKYPEEYRTRQRRGSLKRLYGLTLEEYEAMLTKQGGVCLLCDEPPTGRWLCVDHCHDSGAIRGLLCQRCNRTLGLYDDNADWFARAARYLRKHQKR